MDPLQAAIHSTLLGETTAETFDQIVSLTAAVQRQIFCDVSSEILDIRRAVYLETDEGPAYVMAATAWDEHRELFEAGLARRRWTITKVIDGRELHEKGAI